MRVRGLVDARLWLLCAAVLGLSCERRPQLLVIVDTDAALAAQLLTDPTISPDAVVDTVRIDRFDADWRQTCVDEVDCTANFVLPDPSLWPFSFGVAAPEGGGASALHMRLRLFRGAAAAKGLSAAGDATIEPPAEAAIDRLVDVPIPASGEVVVRVFLSADCLGVPVSFYKGAHTCVDASSVTALAAPSSGVEVSGAEDRPTKAGTWPPGHVAECGPGPGGDTLCIRGGFSFLGEAALADVDEQSDVGATPPRPVHVSPFWMDRTEMTVGRFRALVNDGKLTPESGNPELYDPGDMNLKGCTWLGASDPGNDDYPIDCLSWGLAKEACEKSGGSLPTEAQWEHAARGRGQGRIYPWGDASPECCTAGAGRGTPLCGEFGPEKVGSHPPSPSCGGLGDVSRDGLIDMGGNLSEMCADKLVPYSEGCWSKVGVFVNPLCEDDGVSEHAARGGNWASGTANTRSAFRKGDNRSALYGVRCVYPAGSP